MNDEEILAMGFDTTQKALEKFGIESQLRQTQEECAELIHEISKHMRGRSTIAPVIGELVDVMIMVEQISFYASSLGIDVSAVYNQKIKKLRSKLELDG